MTTHRLLPLALLALTPLASAGGVCIFEGPAGGFGAVRIYDEASGALSLAPLELANVRLLPIDASGRTDTGAVDPRTAHQVVDASVERLVLPQGRGSLYHYVRDESGTAHFGYFVVDSVGVATVRFELASPSLLDDPFVGRVAVSPQGDAFLVATKSAHGGDLYEITTNGPAHVDARTATLGPRRFGGDGLVLTETFGAAVAPRGVLRFERTSGASAAVIAFPTDANPFLFRGEIVASGNGAFAAVVGNVDASGQHVYVFGANGDARRASEAPAPISPAGFSPAYGHGPFLAVSDDGTRAAWSTKTVLSRECFLNRVAPAPAIAEQVSSDARILDTLDEVGLFSFRPTGELLVAIGAVTTGAPGIERIDLFSAELPPAAPLDLQNVTLSSGDSTVPFYSDPALDPEAMVRLPNRDQMLMHVRESSDGSLLFVDATNVGTFELLPFVKSLDLLERVEGRYLIGLRRSNGSKPEQLYRWNGTASAPQLVVTHPDGTLFQRAATRRTGEAAYVIKFLAGGELLERVDLATGVREEFSPTQAQYGPALAWTEFGAVALTRVSGAASEHVVWPKTGPSVVLAAGAGRILPSR